MPLEADVKLMTERMSEFDLKERKFSTSLNLGNGTSSPSNEASHPGDPSPNGGINPSISFLCLRSEARGLIA